VWKLCVAALDFRTVCHRDKVVFEGQRDHDERDDEKGAADDDAARFRNFCLDFLLMSMPNRFAFKKVSLKKRMNRGVRSLLV